MSLEQTELNAVNVLFAAIGNTSLNSLSDPHPDRPPALTVLNAQIAKTLSIGWWFNREFGVELQPNDNNIIDLPTDILTIDPSNVNVKYVKRSGKLYDMTNHTFYITESVECDINYFVELADMPYPAYDYIVSRAAYTFAADMEQDETQLSRLYAEASEAFRVLKRADLQAKDTNILSSPRAQMAMRGMPTRYRRSWK